MVVKVKPELLNIYISKYRETMREQFIDETDAEILKNNEKIHNYLLRQLQRRIQEDGQDLNSAFDEEFYLLSILDRQAAKAQRKRKSRERTLNYIFNIFVDLTDVASTSGGRFSRIPNLLQAPGTGVAIDVFGGIGLAGNILTMIAIPFIYIYHAVQGKKPPITFSNNMKLALATISAILGIIAFTVPPAGVAIMFLFASMTIAVSVIGLVRLIKDRRELGGKIADSRERVKSLYEQRTDLESRIHKLTNQIKDQIKAGNPTPLKMKENANRLAILQKQFDETDSELYKARTELHGLYQNQSKQKTIFAGVTTLTRVIMACTVIVGVGLLLNPFTAPAGVGLIVATGAVYLALFIAEKIHEAKMSKLKELPSDNSYLARALQDEPDKTLKQAPVVRQRPRKKVTFTQNTSPLVSERQHLLKHKHEPDSDSIHDIEKQNDQRSSGINKA